MSAVQILNNCKAPVCLVTAAFQHVRENIEDLNGRVGANDTDLIFLKGLMDSPIMRSLVKVSYIYISNSASWKDRKMFHLTNLSVAHVMSDQWQINKCSHGLRRHLGSGLRTREMTVGMYPTLVNKF
jgi:hypothetical protein